MRKFIFFLLLTTCYFQFTACHIFSPVNYFNIAVLNSNMMHGFASDGLQRELESPSVKMVDGDKNNIAPMKRKEVLDDKIQSISSNFERLKQLDETGDTKEMLRASKALHDYVLPVYKNEYVELARLYDDGAAKESITTYAQSIHDKYYPRFIELFNNLIATGKSYAEKHGINVNWDVYTSPQ